MSWSSAMWRRQAETPDTRTALTRTGCQRQSVAGASRTIPGQYKPSGLATHIEGLERVKGIEPSSLAWEAKALPLSYTRHARIDAVNRVRRQGTVTACHRMVAPDPSCTVPDGGSACHPCHRLRFPQTGGRSIILWIGQPQVLQQPVFGSFKLLGQDAPLGGKRWREKSGCPALQHCRYGAAGSGGVVVRLGVGHGVASVDGLAGTLSKIQHIVQTNVFSCNHRRIRCNVT